MRTDCWIHVRRLRSWPPVSHLSVSRCAVRSVAKYDYNKRTFKIDTHMSDRLQRWSLSVGLPLLGSRPSALRHWARPNTAIHPTQRSHRMWCRTDEHRPQSGTLTTSFPVSEFKTQKSQINPKYNAYELIIGTYLFVRYVINGNRTDQSGDGADAVRHAHQNTGVAWCDI